MKTILLLSLFFNLAFCEIVVMISTKNKLVKVTKKELTDIYLKKKSKIRGITVIPIDNRKDYASFCKNVMNKTPKQMRAYWARELYRGTKKPPKVKNNKQIKKAIKENSKIISYASNKLTGKIILKISN
ncbi:MAG TPA: hypothetical protein EYG94_07840 [Campylobacterales bacterium]|nr:hypothetical protein [Campylobacterales bacterium]